MGFNSVSCIQVQRTSQPVRAAKKNVTVPKTPKVARKITVAAAGKRVRILCY